MADGSDTVNDALRITSVLNKHMAEPNCTHTIKEITEEIFR